MGKIIERKDHSSICCSQLPVYRVQKKIKRIELTFAFFFITAGTFILLAVH